MLAVSHSSLELFLGTNARHPLGSLREFSGSIRPEEHLLPFCLQVENNLSFEARSQFFP